MQVYAKYIKIRLSLLSSYSPLKVNNVGCRLLSAFLILFASVSFLPKATAQLVEQENENIHFGLLLGGGCNTTFPSASPWQFSKKQTQTSVTGGAYFQYDFAKRFFVHLEAGIADRKLLFNGHSDDSTRGNYDTKIAYTNINIPVGIGINFLPKESDFNAGLFLAVVVGLPQETSHTISVGDKNIERRIYPVNVGGMVNLRFRYRFIFLDLRYEMTGTPVFKYEGVALRNGTFSFMVGFQIF